MASELELLKETIEGLSKTFADFKSINDERLKEVKTLGRDTGETKQALDRVNKALDGAMDMKAMAEKALEANKEMKGRIDLLETVIKRGGGMKTTAGDGSELTPEQVEHKGLFHGYLKSGDASSLRSFKDKVQKAMSIISDQDGGYFVTPDFSGKMAKRIYETSPMRQICSQQSISTDALQGLYDIDQAGAGWVGETASRPATNSPQIGFWRIPVYELYAKPQISQQLLEDANINVEGFVADKVADRFTRLENTSFVVGTGATQPKGVLSYAAGTAWGQIETQTVATTFTANSLMATLYSLKEWYRAGAVWCCTRTSQGILRTLVDGQNRYIWQPGIELGQPGMLLGYPVKEMADVPEVASSTTAKMMMFGNFKEGYQIVDRIGVSILRDPFSSKPFVEFYARKRTGGDVINFEAIKVLARSS